MDVVRGAKGPILNKAIVDQLAAEHRVQDEGAERKVVSGQYGTEGQNKTKLMGGSDKGSRGPDF